jgi:PKD domain
VTGTRARAATCLAIVAGILLLTPVPASATNPISPSGSLTGGQDGGASAGGSSPGSGQPVSLQSGGLTSPTPNQSGYTWSLVGQDQQAICYSNGTSAPWNVGTPPPPPPPGSAIVAPNPLPNLYQLIDPQGNPVGNPVDVCPGGVNAVPQPPPAPPPSPAEIVAATPFPVETIHHNPCYVGLTGLQAWLWATVGNGVVSAIAPTVQIRGYTVEVVARPVSYRWDLGDGGARLGSVSGTDQTPSVDYIYQTKGRYTVTLTVSWSGTYTFSGNGVAPQTANLGPVAQGPRHLVWPVQEVRSVLVTPGVADPSASDTASQIPSAC